MRDCRFERLDDDLCFLDFEVDLVSQFVLDHDGLLQRVGQGDFLDSELTQLDGHVVQFHGVTLVRLEVEFVPQLADRLAQEAQRALPLERLQRREEQLVLLGRPGFQCELRLTQEPLSVHDDIERRHFVRWIVNLDRELHDLFFETFQVNCALRVWLLGNNFDYLPPVFPGVVREGYAASQFARDITEDLELVEFVLPRPE